MAKENDDHKSRDHLQLLYSFGPDGTLISVSYHGPLTPEIHEKIKEAAFLAREIGKGRS